MSKRLILSVLFTFLIAVPAQADYQVSDGDYQGSNDNFILQNITSSAGGGGGIDNGTGKLLLVSDNSDNGYQYVTDTPFDFAGASNDTTTQITTDSVSFVSWSWSPKGDTLFAITFNDEVYQWQTTDFDISTASNGGNFSLSSISSISSSYDIEFHPSGDTFYVLSTDGLVFNYSTSASFDVSSPSSNNSFGLTGCNGQPRGIGFNNDGTKLFAVDDDDDNMCQYDMTKAFDLSTISKTNEISLGQVSRPIGLAVGGNGDKFFVADLGTVDVKEHTMSTKFDISTASQTDTLDLSNDISTVRGLAWDLPAQYN